MGPCLARLPNKLTAVLDLQLLPHPINGDYFDEVMLLGLDYCIITQALVEYYLLSKYQHSISIQILNVNKVLYERR